MPLLNVSSHCPKGSSATFSVYLLAGRVDKGDGKRESTDLPKSKMPEDCKRLEALWAQEDLRASGWGRCSQAQSQDLPSTPNEREELLPLSCSLIIPGAHLALDFCCLARQGSLLEASYHCHTEYSWREQARVLGRTNYTCPLWEHSRTQLPRA